MKKLAIAFSALAIGTVTASAADIAPRYTKAPVAAPVPVATWTGCYVGANLGWVGGDDNLFTHPGPPSAFFGQNFNPSPNAHSYTPHDSGVTGGGQIGCNYQTGSWVFGVEGDINASSLRERSFATYPDIIQTLPAATTWSAHTEAVSKDMDWYSTIRGRLGFAVTPAWMIYATGGVAFAHFNTALDYASLTAGFHLVGANSTTRTGWAAGAGTEWMFSPNWSVKAEYLFLDFGTTGLVAPNIAGGPGDPRTWIMDTRLREHIARVGINYKFGWGGPVVAKY